VVGGCPSGSGWGPLGELVDGDEGGGEVEVEDHDGGVAVGHPAELAVTLRPMTDQPQPAPTSEERPILGEHRQAREDGQGPCL
jgi:hypothetical protein